MIQPEQLDEFLSLLKHPDNPSHVKRLLDGNRHWIDGIPDVSDQRKLRSELVDSQIPSIVILTCADSRVSPEYIFDARIGELFVIRVAGNVVSPEILASIEFAVDELGSTLVCVLGHENCGAIQTKLRDTENHTVSSTNLLSVLNRIKVTSSQSIQDNVISNVKIQTQLVKTNSYIITAKHAAAELDIVGMYYSLESGLVSLLSYLK